MVACLTPGQKVVCSNNIEVKCSLLCEQGFYESGSYESGVRHATVAARGPALPDVLLLRHEVLRICEGAELVVNRN